MPTSEDISVVVCAHDLFRELPRTVRSLLPPYQRDVDPARVEIIVADNGSSVPVDAARLDAPPGTVRIVRFPPGNPSPCAPLNAAVRIASGALLCVLIDGARLASPGLLARARAATRLAPDVFVATMGFHLGWRPQQDSQLEGYGSDVEDELLRRIGWPDDGYRLFEICARGESYRGGVLSAFPETTAFMMRRTSFERVGGFNEAFRYRGGGLANFDFYERTFHDDAITPVVLLGEGTFHQVHDGNTTRAGGVRRRETVDGPTIWEAMAQEFQAIVGRPPLSVPVRRPLLFGRCETDASTGCFFGETPMKREP